MASARRRARDARDACLQSRRGAASVASGAGMALSGVLVAAPLANAASRTVAEAPRGGPMAVSASGYCFEARRCSRRLRRGHGPFGHARRGSVGQCCEPDGRRSAARRPLRLQECERLRDGVEVMPTHLRRYNSTSRCRGYGGRSRMLSKTLLG